MSNPVTFHDPTWNAYRLLSFLWRDDFHVPNLYAILSQDEENGGDVLPRAIGVFDGDTQALISAKLIDWDGTGTFPLTNKVGPVIRPPLSDKLYLAYALDSLEDGNSTYFTELDAVTLDFSKKSLTPLASGAGFTTRSTISVFSNIDGSYVGAKFSGDGTTPIGSIGIWDTKNNLVKYFSASTDFGYTVSNQPAHWCFADDGFLYVFVPNHITPTVHTQNTIDKYSVGFGPTLTKVASYNFDAPDAVNQWVNYGVFFKENTHELVLHNQLLGVSDITYQVQKWNVNSETLTATFAFGTNAFGDFVGQTSPSGAIAGQQPLGQTGTWSNVSVIGHPFYDIPGENHLDGFQLLDLNTGIISRYNLSLWPTDPALANLTGGTINYVPSANTIWTWRLNDIIQNPDGTYKYEGFAVYGFGIGANALRTNVPMPPLNYAYDVHNLGPKTK